MAHVAEWKKKEVAEIKNLVESHDVVGIANLANIPAKQLQQMRQSLTGKAIIRMSKKNLIDLALQGTESKNNIIGLNDHMDGQPAMIFTEMNPFKLFKILESNKTSAPAKTGNIATEDIVVPKGDTGFEPGPILGELQQVGIPAKIDKGKIVVNDDHVVVKAGEAVSAPVASMLTRLDIQPMEVGIDLRAAYEDETIYTSDLLTIDDEQTLVDIKTAFTKAFNLSLNAPIYTTQTMDAIISNAASKSMNLAIYASVLNSKTSEIILAKAYAQMLAIARAVSSDDDALDEDLKSKLANVAAAPVATETTADEVEEEEVEEEDSEEEAAAGLGALFG
ncbi:MAG: 50S ribosomal protein L10 [Methanobacteriaceae archaeon]